jgi:hypothetical protein
MGIVQGYLWYWRGAIDARVRPLPVPLNLKAIRGKQSRDRLEAFTAFFISGHIYQKS